MAAIYIITVETHYNESQGTRTEIFFIISKIHYNQLHFHSRTFTGSHEVIHCTCIQKFAVKGDFFITSFHRIIYAIRLSAWTSISAAIVACFVLDLSEKIECMKSFH